MCVPGFVHSTRWPAGGYVEVIAGIQNVAADSSAKRNKGLPQISRTHSASAWSYQNPGGLAWPVDTMRCTISPGSPSRG